MKVTAKQYSQVLYDLTKDANKDQLKQVMKKFVGVLLKNNQFSQVDKIIDFYQQIYNKNEKIVPAEIVSAHKLDEETTKLLKDFINKKLVDKKTEIISQQDERLKGGFLIKYGDKSLDFSIANRLRQLKNKISN